MQKNRARIEVTWDLDGAYGWNYEAGDVANLIQKLLEERIGHYNPVVKVVDNGRLEDAIRNAIARNFTAGKDNTDVEFDSARDIVSLLKELGIYDGVGETEE